jgi:hypothetical protein
MAGAGYKLFNTGDVLTAAQVNTYLQEQTVMVFANAAARTTALASVLAEGMITYLKDTDAVEKYDGSTWSSVSGASSPLTTKGDLYTYSTTNARLAVGSNGDTLVADSSASTGLRWQGNFAAGKNKIINGDFNINQRAFSSTTTSGTYGFDRFQVASTDGTVTYSAQTFTVGAAPVAGYESVNFARLVSSGQTLTTARAILQQPIEDVRSFAGQTVTLSFWAKASTGTPSVAASFTQSFGTGGSASVDTAAGKTAITTSWARYSLTVAIPSISGKTIGTSATSLIPRIWISAGTDYNATTTSLGIQSVTVDFWGVQLESGSVATAFQTATGTLAGELAACQRYYWRSSAFTGGVSAVHGFGTAEGTGTIGLMVKMPVTMRVTPTAIDYASVRAFDGANLIGTPSSVALITNNSNADQAYVTFNKTSSFTQFRPYFLLNDATTSGYIGFTAEL